MVRWNIMIHYFIAWFEYNVHYKNCIKHVHMGGIEPEYQKQNVQQESSLFSRGVSSLVHAT
jgi:hypothetical protein